MNKHATPHSVAVIGSGLGGLAAACTLAARGYRVTVFEKNTWVGGKAAVLNEQGFRFDMGPTILPMPNVLRRIFDEAGRQLENELDLVRLDPQWRCFFDDGSTLDLRESMVDMQREIASLKSDTDLPAQYERFVAFTERLHDISERFFFWKPIGGMRDMMDPRTAFSVTTLRDVLSMRMGDTVAGSIRKYVDDDRLAQMLDHFTQYVGSSPFNSPAVLCGIASMQLNEGVWYPMGGTRAVPDALHRLAIDLGVQFHTNTQVSQLIIEKNQVRGLVTDSGEQHNFDAVVSNMDAVRTSRELVTDHRCSLGFDGDRYTPACSGVVLYLGLNRRYEHLAHHSFVFSQDPEDEFTHIYEHGEPAPDPTCYLAAPAATEPDVAPPDGEALYVLVHTPYLRKHHDWKKMLSDYRQIILDKLKRTAGMEDIEQRIVYERTLTPQDIHDRYHVLNGAIYGLASHGRFLGAFKPSNRTAVRGLYLAGGSAHPGPGMPMVLMSGWIAGDTLDRDGVIEPDMKRVEAEPAMAP